MGEIVTFMRFAMKSYGNTDRSNNRALECNMNR